VAALAVTVEGYCVRTSNTDPEAATTTYDSAQIGEELVDRPGGAGG
jgi:hypothetical protein